MKKGFVKVVGAMLFSAIFTPVMSEASSCEDGVNHYIAGEYKDAVEIWTDLAQAHDACAEYWLGKAYNLGQGVPKDSKKALELFRASASQGYDKARVELSF